MRPSHALVLATLFSIMGTAIVAAPALATEPCQATPTAAPTSPTTHVELSELYPSPLEGEEEFIELHNGSTGAVDLAGWSIADASGKTFALPTDDATISAGGYRVFPFSQTKIYLNNDSDTITLLRTDASTADATTYEKATRGEAWARINNAWQWTTNVTADAANSASASPTDAQESPAAQPPTPSPNTGESSNAVIINELLPNPSGSETTDEWIELFNAGDTTVNLDRWQLTDQTRYYTFADTRIPAHGYAVFESGETRINLNNTGDTVYLVDPVGVIKNGTTYEAAAENTAWANVNNSWSWTATPTPGKQNAIQSNEEKTGDNPSPDDPTELSIAEAQQQTDGAIMSITGVVSVTPGVFSTQYFYIQDSSGGMQIYSYAKQFPQLAVGDLVAINGEKSTIRGEPRIKTSVTEDIVVMKNNTTVTIADVPALEEAAAGTLARMTGTVTQATSTGAMLDDVTPIVIKSTTGVRKDLFPIGETVSVTGVVLLTGDGAVLVPRSATDIETIAAESSLIPAAHAAKLPTARSTTDTPTTVTAATRNAPSFAGIGIIALAAAAVVTAGVILQLKKKKEAAGVKKGQ